MIITDAQAYEAYPHHRQFFNKLWLAEYLGHKCGPAGYAPSDPLIPDNIIVRPIYNLSGMGVGSHVVNIAAEQSSRYLVTPTEKYGPPISRADVLRTLPAGTFLV